MLSGNPITQSMQPGGRAKAEFPMQFGNVLWAAIGWVESEGILAGAGKRTREYRPLAQHSSVWLQRLPVLLTRGSWNEAERAFRALRELGDLSLLGRI